MFAAEGYAKVTGEVGVCIATSGPGATNLVTGLADALLDSVPMVAITGQVMPLWFSTGCAKVLRVQASYPIADSRPTHMQSQLTLDHPSRSFDHGSYCLHMARCTSLQGKPRFGGSTRSFRPALPAAMQRVAGQVTDPCCLVGSAQHDWDRWVPGDAHRGGDAPDHEAQLPGAGRK